MIGIVNYGMGNLASVKNAFDYLKVDATIVSEPSELQRADHIVVPGVGAFGMAVGNLRSMGFADAISELVLVKQVPILGLCLGMQLLFDGSSEHGDHRGLGIIPGQVRFLGDVVRELSIPHVGWNDVAHGRSATLFKNVSSPASYYFVHGYYCDAANPEDVAGTTEYGISFPSSVERGNVFGCQFHPEKSQKNGLAVLKRFSSV